MLWDRLDGIAMFNAGKMQALTLARKEAGTLDGVVVGGLRAWWTLIGNDPERELVTRGIDPLSPPSLIELLHLRPYPRSILYDCVDGISRSIKRRHRRCSAAPRS